MKIENIQTLGELKKAGYKKLNQESQRLKEFTGLRIVLFQSWSVRYCRVIILIY